MLGIPITPPSDNAHIGIHQLQAAVHFVSGTHPYKIALFFLSVAFVLTITLSGT
jgi:hypothetical protein